MDLHEYSTYCGPDAFAAITGCSSNDAARSLILWSKRAGWPPQMSTSPTVLLAALSMRGYPAETWDVHAGGWRSKSADEVCRWIWARIRTEARDWQELEDQLAEYGRQSRKPRPRAVRRALDNALRVSRERAARRRRQVFTVREWIGKRRAGMWILHVARHLLVARAGAIVAGDDASATEYGGEPLLQVWRVLPRRRL